MKKLQLIIFAGLLFSMGGCITEPSACFSMSANTVAVGETISFTNCSFLAKNYFWDFGDGTTSTEKAPSHSWSVADTTYKVSLLVTSRTGETSEVANNVTIE